ncbi:hypothetical protein ACFVT9_29630 [Kitasatospora cineracea]|uniref:hypothetical protein n=1 Tax=Kitasatospora cineracea TaxID=88074 RepID=UPI0036D98F15
MVAHVGRWRVVARTATGRERVVDLDPAAFRCRVLVDELGAEWTDYAQMTRPHPTGVFAYRQAIRDLCAFVDRKAGDQAGSCSLARQVPDVAFYIREWMRELPSRWPEGSQRPYALASFVLALIRFRGLHGGRPLAPNVQRLTTIAAPVRPGGLKELEEFTRAEKRQLVRAAWQDVRVMEERLALGRRLVEEGGHPDEHGWLDPANLLWGLSRGEVTPRQIWEKLPHHSQWPAGLHAVFEHAGVRFQANTCRALLTIALAALLHPRNVDLQAFRVLLVAATGHSPDEIAALTEDDIEYLPGGVRLRMVKRRARKVRAREFRDPPAPDRYTHPDQRGLSVKEIVERLSAVTAEARRRCTVRPGFLFTVAFVANWNHPRHPGQLVFRPFEPVGVVNGDFGDWAERAGVQVAGKLDIRRLRKSTKVKKAIAFRGVVSDIADDHTEETFLGHYAHGTTLRVLAGHTITTAQRTWLDKALNGPVVLDDASTAELHTPPALAELGLTTEQAEQIRQGELDMGVTNCRDPYDSPYSKQGDLCAVAPLRCLECRNAFVLPSNLPQLLLFADHLEGLRKRLSPQHFHRTWGQSHTNLKAVLAERTANELEAATTRITEQGLRLQLPLSALVEFDA